MLNEALIVSLLMFFIGALGVTIRKNAIVVFMCIELMFNAVNLVWVVAGNMYADISTHLAAFLVIIVAVSEAVVGLGIVIALFKAKKTIETDQANRLNG